MSGDRATERNDGRLARIDDYVRGRDDELAGDVDAFEEELFARAIAGDALDVAFHDELVEGIAALAERGTLVQWITATDLASLRARYGERLAVLEVPAGDGVHRVVLPDDVDLVVTRITVDLRGSERVDVDALTPDDVLIKTMFDARYDPEDGALYTCCEIDLARAVVGAPVKTRIWAVRDGERRVVHEMTTEAVLAG